MRRSLLARKNCCEASPFLREVELACDPMLCCDVGVAFPAAALRFAAARRFTAVSKAVSMETLELTVVLAGAVVLGKGKDHGKSSVLRPCYISHESR